MHQRKDHYLVPEQQKGISKDLSVSIKAMDFDEADDWFIMAKDRLLDVNDWNNHSDLFNSKFKLTDAEGKEVNRHAHTGDYIRIDATGAQYRWVHIESIEYDDYPDENKETIAIRLHASPSPQEKGKEEMLDYFHELPTSTIVIERMGNHLYATYHGRNESNHLDGNIINGAWLGSNDHSWEELLSAILPSETIS